MLPCAGLRSEKLQRLGVLFSHFSVCGRNAQLRAFLDHFAFKPREHAGMFIMSSPAADSVSICSVMLSKLASAFLI
jgi:hypothetical protein